MELFVRGGRRRICKCTICRMSPRYRSQRRRANRRERHEGRQEVLRGQ